MISVEYLLVVFTEVDFSPSEIPRLRGYFAQKYPDTHLFHNHMPGASLDYRFPKIQYRIVDGHPALIGLGEGIEIMKRVFFETTEIVLGTKIWNINERTIKLTRTEFGQSAEYYTYRFISPWMALNQDNHRDFIELDQMRQKQKLKSILRGNLLTLAKGLSYTIPDFDRVELDGWFKPVERNFHKIPMQCFTGEFTTNFLIPDLLGLGKQVARGFGVMKRIMEER